MRFRLVEDLSTLEEDFEALLEAELAKKKTIRGETSLRECLCSLLEWKLDYTKYMLHHKDGDHFNNDIDNLILLPTNLEYKNPNTHIHKMTQADKLTMDRTKTRTKKYRNYLDELKELNGIDVFNSLRSGKLMSPRKTLITVFNSCINI